MKLFVEMLCILVVASLRPKKNEILTSSQVSTYMHFMWSGKIKRTVYIYIYYIYLSFVSFLFKTMQNSCRLISLKEDVHSWWWKASIIGWFQRFLLQSCTDDDLMIFPTTVFFCWWRSPFLTKMTKMLFFIPWFAFMPSYFNCLLVSEIEHPESFELRL